MIHYNRIIAIPIILAIVFFECIAQSCLKISKSNKVTSDRQNMYIVFSMVAYSIVCLLLTVSYDYMPFSLVNSVWSALSIISMILIGIFYFEEVLPLHDKIALFLIFLGIFIIYFVNGNDDKVISNDAEDILKDYI